MGLFSSKLEIDQLFNPHRCKISSQRRFFGHIFGLESAVFSSLLQILFIEPFNEHHVPECSRISFQEDKRKYFKSQKRSFWSTAVSSEDTIQYFKSQKRSFDWQLWVLRIQSAVQKIPNSMECEYNMKASHVLELFLKLCSFYTIEYTF